MATQRLLEAARLLCPSARIFLAASGEMFGRTESPADEETPFAPRSPYAASKVMAYWAGVNYRESYGQFVANGIFYNYESPRRPPHFVTKKVVRGAVEIAVLGILLSWWAIIRRCIKCWGGFRDLLPLS